MSQAEKIIITGDHLHWQEVVDQIKFDCIASTYNTYISTTGQWMMRRRRQMYENALSFG